jgi:hypothetical protein
LNLPDDLHTREAPFPVRLFLLISLVSVQVCFVLFLNSFDESLFKNLVQARNLTENNLLFFESGLMNNQLTAPGWTALLSSVWKISPGSILISRCLAFAGHLLAMYYLMRFITMLTRDQFWAFFAGILWGVDPILLSDAMLLSGGSWFSAFILAGLYHYLHYKNGVKRSFYFSAFLLGCAYLFLLSSWIVLVYIFAFIIIDTGKFRISRILIGLFLFLLPFFAWHLFETPGSASLLMWGSVMENRRFLADGFDIVIRVLVYLPLLIGLVPLFFSNIKPSSSAIRPLFWAGLLFLSLSCVSFSTGSGLLLITAIIPISLLSLFSDSMTRIRKDESRRKFPTKVSDLFPIPYFIPVLLILLINSLAVGYFVLPPIFRQKQG